jgi:serine/threonine-protein kinase
MPGTVLAARYRMIGLLGRGGMGEVYRADDMKLGQPVALKFLPGSVEGDPERLERFLTEVRLSLRVTHPNVCRVFDIGQIDQRSFLSMEYVDGEDLASLLRRIGRLPEDKAIEIARQLCAGLAAAHDEGVLHRDLKPANIMIDGRGRAKITDFGLAGATEGISGGEARAGTPQYMAPEQVAGRALTVQTDLYSLGLVLYELFTGKRAYDLKDGADLERLQGSAPTNPSSHVSGLNPLVERAILRCLEADPARRPASASALAAALPGGDPLAMAIAAGDTPSPEMVAAAGSNASLRPAIAWSLVAVAIAGAVIGSALAEHTSIQRAGAMPKSPDVMVERAREILKTAGFPDAAQDSAWGPWKDPDYLNYIAAHPAGAGYAPQGAFNGMRFWYRESPQLLERRFFAPPDGLQRPFSFDPEMTSSGEVLIWFDHAGHVTDLTAVPPQSMKMSAPGLDVDWTPLFLSAGLDLSAWTPATPQWTPMHAMDRQAAWVPRRAAEGLPDRVEAASFAARPVSFQLIYPWTTHSRELATHLTPGERVGGLVLILLLVALLVGGALVARRNLQLDRGDQRGAMRLAGFVASLSMVTWMIDEHHVPSPWEFELFLMGAGSALVIGAFVAIFYLAVEPYVRRAWPTLIVSWSRIVAGTIRDPLVARDVLIGCAWGGVNVILSQVVLLVSRHYTGVLPKAETSIRPFLGVSHVVSELAAGLAFSIFIGLLLVFFLVLVMWPLRRVWLAVVVVAIVLTVPDIKANAMPIQAIPLAFLVVAMRFAVFARFGLVAAMVGNGFVSNIIETFPATFPPNQWYSGAGFAGLAVVAVLAVYACRIATGSMRQSARG